MLNALGAGQAILLENLRFHHEEEANDRDFAHELARGKHVYVNDAFGTAHRAHASTAGVTRYISERAPGFLMMREIEALSTLTLNPEHPYVAILGGAKVSDKIGVIRNLMTKVDAFLIGGAMAYTFLRALGQPTGRSRVEEDKIELAAELLQIARNKGVAFELPSDHVVAESLSAETPGEVVTTIPEDKIALDIGPETIKRFVKDLQGAKTVVWNGPMGLFEVGAIRPRHLGRRRGARQQFGAQRAWRRRYRCGSRRSTVGREVLAYLHWWRRQPGVPRGPRITRHQGAGEIAPAHGHQSNQQSERKRRHA